MCFCKEPGKKGWTHDTDCCWLTAAFPSFKAGNPAEPLVEEVARNG